MPRIRPRGAAEERRPNNCGGPFPCRERLGVVSGAPSRGQRVDERLLVAQVSRHQIGAQVERFKFADANKALDFVRQGNPRYRAVLEA